MSDWKIHFLQYKSVIDEFLSSPKVSLCFLLSSSAADTAFDAIIGCIEDIIMGMVWVVTVR